MHVRLFRHLRVARWAGAALTLAVGLGCLASAGEALAKKARFTNFPGPVVPITVKPDEKAWVAGPLGNKWDSLKFAQYKFVRKDGNEGVFEFAGSQFHVPSAFIFPAKVDPRLGPGHPVMLSVYVASAYGRIVSVNGDTAKVNFIWGSKPEIKEFKRSELIGMDGRDHFGSPIAFKKGKVWKHGRLVRKGPEMSWVIGFAGKLLQIPTDTLRTVLMRNYKVGERVSARWVSEFKPGTIQTVLHGGLKYRVKLDQFNKPEEKVFAEVTTLLE